jgi:short-subunit dehydrogenase
MRLRLKPLAEQVIVITGASSGIGLATAVLAARRGARVVLAAREEGALREIRDAILTRGGKAIYVVADVGARDDVELIAAEAERHYGGFDTWVNNAGVGIIGRLEDTADADHQRLFQTNYWGVVHGSLVALRLLKRRGGALVNMGSVVSEMPAPLQGAYAASKHAVKGFTDALRIELLEEGAPVAVALIQPQAIDTPFAAHAKTSLPHATRLPPPLLAPERVAEAVLHAATHPVRDLVVGGAGRAQVMASWLAPGLTDRLFARVMRLALQDRRRPARAGDALHQAGGGARRHGSQGHLFRNSLSTSAAERPMLALGLGVLAGAALLGALGARGSRAG